MTSISFFLSFLSQVDEDLNLSMNNDVIIMSDDEDDVNAELLLRIKWGSTYIRVPIRRVSFDS